MMLFWCYVMWYLCYFYNICTVFFGMDFIKSHFLQFFSGKKLDFFQKFSVHILFFEFYLAIHSIKAYCYWNILIEILLLKIYKRTKLYNSKSYTNIHILFIYNSIMLFVALHILALTHCKFSVLVFDREQDPLFWRQE